MIDVRCVSAALVLPLRHAVLRAGLPLDAARFEGDARPDTIHLAAFDAARDGFVGMEAADPAHGRTPAPQVCDSWANVQMVHRESPAAPAAGTHPPQRMGFRSRTFHDAYDGEAIVGVASLMVCPMPDLTDAHRGVQLRGMAVAAAYRRQGIGTLLLERAIELAREGGASVLWCNARAPVVGFYRRFTFAPHGEPFEVPGIGPHHRMSLRL